MIASAKSTIETLNACGVPDRDVAMYSTVARKHPILNMQARELWLKLGYESPEYAREIWMLCARDPLFFINTFCIAAGTLVVTDRGPVPIESVLPSDKVWDGEEWVNQMGPIHQGRKEVIYAYGIELTPDHKVMTKEGWKRADNDRFDRKAIRTPDGYSSRWGLSRAGGVGVPMRMWEDCDDMRLQSEKRRDSKLRLPDGRRSDARSKRYAAVSRLPDNALALYEREQSVVSTIWWARHHSLRTVANIRELRERHGRAPQRDDDRAEGQQQGVLQRELPLGVAAGTGKQHSQESFHRYDSRQDDDCGGRSDRRNRSQRHTVPDKDRKDRGRTVCSQDSTRTVEVYDLINCGPRRAFTVLSDDGTPLLVHNCYLLETREKQAWNTSPGYGTSKVIPFITRGYQDDLILKCVENLGRRDIIIPKSRETGISWIIVALSAWDWVFHEQTAIGFVSKDLLSANNPDDPDALFSKFEFLLTRLPFWLMSPLDYERNIGKNTFKNLKNNASLTAYPAKADFGRGGRKTFLFMDEFHFFEPGEDKAAMDSSVHVTPCRLFVSTANRDRGMAGAFYDAMTDDSRNGVIVVVDWKDDPDKRRGLYHGELVPHSDTYRLVIDDMDFWMPFSNWDQKKTYRHPTKPGENYPFIVDERTRSLYYDDVWMRTGSTPQSVSAELDRNFGGATAQIFNPTLLAATIDKAKVATSTGDLVRNPEKRDEWLFEKMSVGGLTSLWCVLDDNGNPPRSEYSFGADIAAGTGGEWSSYSVLEGIDKKTGEQCFEWRSNRMDPIQFAELAVWVCKWFHGAYLVPEVNGPLGTLFINKVVVDLKYGNVYHSLKQKVAYKEATEKIGYHNPDRGIHLIKNMEAAVRNKRVYLHSLLALKECGRYFLKNGKLVHSAAEVTEDGAGMGMAHGDAAIALGCAVLGVDDVPVKREVEVKSEAPYLSFLWRRQQFEKSQMKAGQKSYWKPEM